MADVADFDFRLEAPFSYALYGPSMSGKSHHLRNCIRLRNRIMTKRVHKVYYFYETYQTDAFEELQEECGDEIEFIEGKHRTI